MLIVCPSCASRYELDAAKLGPSGRTVRCAKCDTRWHVEPQEPVAPEPQEVPPPRKRPPPRKKSRASARLSRARRLRGLASPLGVTALGLAIIAGLVWQRDLAVRAAPQLASQFERVGLPVNFRG